MAELRANTERLANAAASRARAILFRCLKAAVSVALLALLFSRVDVARLWTVARTASVPWLVLALALYLGDDPGQRLALGPAAPRAAHRASRSAA